MILKFGFHYTVYSLKAMQTCGTFKHKKNPPYRVILNIKKGPWMTQNDGKIYLLLWVETLFLKSYFSTFLLIYSTLE